MAIFVTYDASEQAFAVHLDAQPVARTVEVDDVHLVDLGEDGHVVGIEVLDAPAADLERVAAEYGFEDSLEEITTAVRAVVPTVIATTRLGTTATWVTMEATAGQIRSVQNRSSAAASAVPREIELVGND